MKVNPNFAKIVDGELECAPTYLKGDGETISVPTEKQYLDFGWKKVDYTEPTTEVPEGYRRKGIAWAENETTIFRKPVDKKLVDEVVFPPEPYRIISDYWEETEDSFVRKVIAKPEVDETVWPEEPYRIISDEWEETEDAFVRHVVAKHERDETVWPEEPYRILSDEWEETEDEFVRHVVVKHVNDSQPSEAAKIGYHWEATGEEESDTEITIVYSEVKNPPRTISKLKLIVALKEAGKWDAVKAFISSAGYEDEWQAAQDLSEAYPQYEAAVKAAIDAGIATAEEIEAIVSKSVADTPSTSYPSDLY